MTNKVNSSWDKMLIVRIVLVAAMFIAGAIVYRYLPDMIPTHWGFDGQPNQWSPKIWGAWIAPVLGLLFLILFPLLAKIDPRKNNYELFKKPWGIIQTSLIAFLAYVYAATIYVTFYPVHQDLLGRVMMLGIGLMFIVLGNVMGKVRQNYFIGLRTPWALNDPEVWQKSQRFAGWMFVLAGLIFAIEAIVWLAVVQVFVVSIILITAVPIIYSYLIAQHKKQDHA